MDQKGYSPAGRIVIVLVAIVFVVVVLFVGLVYYLANNLAGGGGSNQIVPDTVQAGEPAVLQLEFSVWGAGGPIKNRYTDIAFYYRLVGESDYKVLQPQPVPENYEGNMKDRYEAFTATIPAYPTGTMGEIEYYYEMKLDGTFNRVNGIKTIKILSGTDTKLGSA